jgi:hypothetical protein
MPVYENADAYVCEPEVGINQQLDAIFIQFDVMDGETQQGTGRSHTVMMSAPDAMQLLQTLLYVQKRFSLPGGKDEPSMIEIPQKKN